MEEEKRCDCDMHHSAGDSAACLWECPKHGIRGYSWIVNVCRDIEIEYSLDPTTVRRKAWEELKRLQGIHRPYFDEDYFARDLKAYFEKSFSKQEKKPKPLLDIQPELIGKSIFKSWVPQWLINWVTK